MLLKTYFNLIGMLAWAVITVILIILILLKSKYLKYCWELNVKKIMFDTEKVRSLTCMGKKSSELKYSLSFFSLSQVGDVFFTSFY